MSLKEITQDLHREAERTEFAKLLLSGKITKKDYANYLYQMIIIYASIEVGNRNNGFLVNLPGIERTEAIRSDFVELIENDLTRYEYLPETIAYQEYLSELCDDPTRQHLIKAHMYCRHMGDLFGGQIIANRVPGSGKFYHFENPDQLKATIREELTDDLGDEARVAFQWAIKIMRALNNEQ